MDKNLAAYLLFGHIRWLRPSHFDALSAHFGSPESAAAAKRAEIGKLDFLGESLKADIVSAMDEFQPDKLAEKMKSLGIAAVTRESKEFPKRLKEIPEPPFILFCKGDLSLLERLSIAVVGSRKTSRYGTQQAEKIAFELAELGIAVISGLALGIDAAAHRGALSARGKTIAILGCGVDVVYPGEHKDLYDQIARDGLIVSEYPPGTEPHAAHFPERNRIISGLSHGVFVAEAARKSGALLTARHAVEQGREVFALPGLATNPQCKGCHHLIKTGQASLVENADDILIALNLSKEELLFGRQAKPKQMTIGYSAEDESEGEIEMEVDRSGYTPAGLSPEERRVLELVSYEGTHINEVARETKMSIAELSAHLTMLEIRGLVTSTSGGYYQRV